MKQFHYDIEKRITGLLSIDYDQRISKRVMVFALAVLLEDTARFTSRQTSWGAFRKFHEETRLFCVETLMSQKDYAQGLLSQPQPFLFLGSGVFMAGITGA